MAYYTITACGAPNSDWKLIPTGFGVRRCTKSPQTNSNCVSSMPGVAPCEKCDKECKCLAYFRIAKLGDAESAWNLAVEKIKELNPRGALAQGLRNPTLPNLNG